MKYVIEFCEVKKTGTGAKGPWTIITMSLKDEQGNITDKVDTFDAVMMGQTIEGTIEAGQYGLNFKKDMTTKQTAGSNFKAQQIEKAVVRKEESIGRFQASKEESIALMAAQRDAVLIVTTMFPQYATGTTESDIKEDIVKWRNWFLSDEFKDIPPF